MLECYNTYILLTCSPIQACKAQLLARTSTRTTPKDDPKERLERNRDDPDYDDDSRTTPPSRNLNAPPHPLFTLTSCPLRAVSFFFYPSGRGATLLLVAREVVTIR